MHAEFRSEWFAGWGTLALVNAGLAQSKHRSGLLWFLASLLLGPFATLLIVILHDPRELDRN
ncbi:MAG TPA: hypothetical protein VNM14_18580 [Planctomycetota bacterium]|nr:hypothetical protein [Planctomycetota bacterium]